MVYEVPDVGKYHMEHPEFNDLRSIEIVTEACFRNAKDALKVLHQDYEIEDFLKIYYDNMDYIIYAHKKAVEHQSRDLMLKTEAQYKELHDSHVLAAKNFYNKKRGVNGNSS